MPIEVVDNRSFTPSGFSSQPDRSFLIATFPFVLCSLQIGVGASYQLIVAFA